MSQWVYRADAGMQHCFKLMMKPSINWLKPVFKWLLVTIEILFYHSTFLLCRMTTFPSPHLPVVLPTFQYRSLRRTIHNNVSLLGLTCLMTGLRSSEIKPYLFSYSHCYLCFRSGSLSLFGTLVPLEALLGINQPLILMPPSITGFMLYL